MEVDFMKKTYRVLYELEKSLRLALDITMSREYGIDWFVRAPLTMNYRSYTKSFSSFYYHELFSLI